MHSLRTRAYRLSRSIGRALRIAPAPGDVQFGDLRRTRPLSPEFGEDRGLAVDRYYIEGFLAAHTADVRGRVLEIGDDVYSRRFGGDRVSRADIWHAHGGNPRATVVGDLADPPPVESEIFDCAIVTQTLQLIYSPPAALASLYRMLKPGGVLLLTVPGISQVATQSEWGPTWYWAFTQAAVRRMLDTCFGPSTSDVRVQGNVLAATAFLHGLAAQELTAAELADTDPDYQVIITARAVKRDD